MKIKRFEAHSMSEALRMVKKEFGPDAVILSAKTVKKSNRVFGARNTGQVIVTAAIDPEPAKSAPANEQAGHGQPSERSAAPADRWDGAYPSKQSILQRFNPITRTGRQILRAKFPEIQEENGKEAPVRSEGCAVTRKQMLHKNLMEQGLAPHIATDLAEQTEALLSSDTAGDQEVRVTLCQVINARPWVAADSEDSGKRPRFSVLLGPPGVGKTTTAAKLAAQLALQQQDTVLISMDNQRAAGTVELERYSRLMGIPLYTAFDPAGTEKAVKACGQAKHVIIDTPGLGPRNQDELFELKNRLGLLGQSELYLLISAAASSRVMQKSIQLYKPLGINRLIITQLDWADIVGPWINTAVQAGLPIAYASESPLVSEGMQLTDAPWLTDQLWPDRDAEVRGESVTVIPERLPATRLDQFVANSSSDIFHRSECRSVQRINSRNVVMFKNQTEAQGLGYKPCRMCCSDLLATKPNDRLPRSNKAASRYFAQ